MHIVTLSFDDGFIHSNQVIADIYESFGLRACFNIVAGAQLEADQWHHGTEPGTDHFALWNELQARGHEIMPHGYQHENLAKMPLADAQASILRCLNIFQEKLTGYDNQRAIFNFPYNASTPEIEAWLPTVVHAFRTAGPGINPLPHAGQTRLTTTAFGPGNGEAYLDQCVDELLALPSGWLIYNTHGLDNEGWGPIGAEYLRRLLERLTAISTVRILPAGVALQVPVSGE
ncbi:MAG: polysaccharide deacetylase family protein [Armatimonadota bacterium]